jgi:hypothetical protein
MYDVLSDRKVTFLKGRRNYLKRSANSYTIWEMWDPPLKSKEEIKKIKEDEKAELELIEKLLKENTRKKAANTRERNRNARMARR